MEHVEEPDRLADLRPNYLERLRKRTDALAAFLQAYDRNDASAEAFESSHRSVHSMASSAAIFGYPELSKAARAAEAAFDEGEDIRAPKIKQSVGQLLDIARDVLQNPAI